MTRRAFIIWPILAVSWIAGLCTAALPPETPGAGRRLRIVSVVVNDMPDSTVVNVSADHAISGYTVQTVPSPPRIVIDIPCRGTVQKSMRIPVDNALLREVRVGYHPEMIRVVLDSTESAVDCFDVQTHGHSMDVTLQTCRSAGKRADESRPAPVRADDPAANCTEPGVPAKSCDPEAAAAGLTDIPPDDGLQDTHWMISGIQAYCREDWQRAKDLFQKLLTNDAAGRYSEKARFLLAWTQDHARAEPDTEQFNEIIAAYQAVITRFPDSSFTPPTMMRLAERYYQHGHDNEALGYFNLVLYQSQEPRLQAWSGIRKARILYRKKRKPELLSLIPEVEQQLGRLKSSPAKESIRVELAKLLFDVNSFHQSLRLLTQTAADDASAIYRQPDLSLFMGYNYLQLGRFEEARRQLLHFYNCFPRRPRNHLVLAQIGDTFRESGEPVAAAKIYQLVSERYPETEGAFISLLRFAEMQEDGVVPADGGLSPKVIYQSVILRLQEKDPDNPLIQLAMLKLASAYQRQKRFIETRTAIESLLSNYPWGILAEEIQKGLIRLVCEILEDYMQSGRYEEVYRYYQSEKELFLKMKSPDALLIVARALIELGLEDSAIQIYATADRMLPKHDEPPDLIFFVARGFYQKGQYDRALRQIDQLNEDFPDDPMALRALHMKYDILFSRKEYTHAAGVSDALLRGAYDGCQRIDILIDQVRALLAAELPLESYAALTRCDGFLKDCSSLSSDVYRELGDLFVRLKHPQDAVEYFQKAEALAAADAEKQNLAYKRAGCLIEDRRRADARSVLKQIAGSQEGFWAALAREKLTQLQFEDELSEMLRQLPRQPTTEDDDEKSAAGTK